MLIRPAHAAGDWYPADADELVTSIAALLLSQPATHLLPFALIVPHGKYNNLDTVSAAAYKHLSQLSNTVDNVVVIAGSEDKSQAAVLPICSRFSTPLGEIPVNPQLCESLSLLPFVSRSDRLHNCSSRIEIQLPFLQTCLVDFQLTPILVGDLLMNDMKLLFEQIPNKQNSLLVLSLDIESKSHESLDPLEQKILQAFSHYCHENKLHLESVGEQKHVNLDKLLSSFVVH